MRISDGSGTVGELPSSEKKEPAIVEQWPSSDMKDQSSDETDDVNQLPSENGSDMSQIWNGSQKMVPKEIVQYSYSVRL